MKETERIVALLRVAISSDNEGECLAALQQVRRFLGKMGATAADVGVYIGVENKPSPAVTVRGRSTHDSMYDSVFGGHHYGTHNSPYGPGFDYQQAMADIIANMRAGKTGTTASHAAAYGRSKSGHTQAAPPPTEKKAEDPPPTSAYKPPPAQTWKATPRPKPRDGSWYLKPGSLSDACLQELRDAGMSACEVAIAASAPINFGTRHRDKSTAWCVDNAKDYIDWYLAQLELTHKIECEFGKSTFRDLVKAWQIYRYHYPKLPDL